MYRTDRSIHGRSDKRWRNLQLRNEYPEGKDRVPFVKRFTVGLNRHEVGLALKRHQCCATLFAHTARAHERETREEEEEEEEEEGEEEE
ncbi:hypothetical protein HZH66_001338 [Vespula vulgaris]|uniref:Uncharacterized protein n=1 Tax=Vespula vulgaris TaxID=7454 RepID=A0A834NK70_VESVU|nr:hypothetical protein HZH66_001338 [Vespula vulgaris]